MLKFNVVVCVNYYDDKKAYEKFHVLISCEEGTYDMYGHICVLCVVHLLHVTSTSAGHTSLCHVIFKGNFG